MRIELNQVTKKYGRQTVLKDLSLCFEQGESYAIYGPNGSGKSTLVQIIAGTISPLAGKVSYIMDGKDISVDKAFSFLSISAPYLELIEEYSLIEILDFHFRFKKVLPGVSKQSFFDLLLFDPNKPIRNYSSGMKQRLKLLLALFSEGSLLLLDEPTANFDEQGILWYQELLAKYQNNRTLIIASAQPADHSFCRKKIELFIS